MRCPDCGEPDCPGCHELGTDDHEDEGEETTMNNLPELTQQPILWVEAQPDEDYAIRILRAYRDNCNCRWATESDGSCDNPLYELMNLAQEQRAEILDKAIAILLRDMR